MKEDKSVVNKFKDEMGFKDISKLERSPPSENEYIGRGKEKLIANFTNYKNEKYECSMVIDSESKKVIKSTCEKSMENDD